MGNSNRKECDREECEPNKVISTRKPSHDQDAVLCTRPLPTRSTQRQSKPITSACGDVLTVSMSFRFSSNADLSLMSLLATHVFIWSRNRCSFLICVFKSVSCFSFCVWLVDACIFSYMLSKSSTPSATFFKVRSISAVWILHQPHWWSEVEAETYSAAFVQPW